MRKQTLNQGWTVTPGDGSSLTAMLRGNVQPKAVTLPHDLLVEQPRCPEEPNGPGNGFFHEQDMVYNTTLNLDADTAGKRIWLEFEAVYQNAFVYVNNAFAGKCAYGYSNFYLDITDYVNCGQPNEIKVVIKNGVPSGRWYTGGGIYRGVNLMIAEPVHLAPDGVFVKTENLDEGIAEVAVCMELSNDLAVMKSLILKAEVKDNEQKIVNEKHKIVQCQEDIKKYQSITPRLLTR